ncbi:MAG: O-antigen ligase family protein, partial [Gaiellales bacterium]
GIGADPDPGNGLIESAISFRLLDLLVPLAIAVRLLVGRRRPGGAVGVLLWAAFLTWLATSALVGVLNSNARDLIAFEAKTIVYIGILLLVVGVPLRRIVVSHGFRMLVIGSAGLAAALVLLDVSGARLTLDVPVVPLESFGAVGGDSASILAAVGVMALAAGVCSVRGRATMLGAAVLLFAPVLAADQRAALLGLAVSLGVVGLLAPFARRRVRTTAAELGLLGLAVVFVVGALAVGGAVLRATSPSVPLVSGVAASFSDEQKQISAASRRNQWSAAPRTIAERPWLGAGLGTTYQFYDPGPKEFVESDTAHNVGLDLLLRAGVIGLALFAIAVALSLVAGVRGWLRLQGDLTAALALASSAIIAGLLAKGMVEDLLEKYRLVVLLGLVAGFTLTALAGRVSRRPRARSRGLARA